MDVVKEEVWRWLVSVKRMRRTGLDEGRRLAAARLFMTTFKMKTICFVCQRSARHQNVVHLGFQTFQSEGQLCSQWSSKWTWCPHLLVLVQGGWKISIPHEWRGHSRGAVHPCRKGYRWASAKAAHAVLYHRTFCVCLYPVDSLHRVWPHCLFPRDKSSVPCFICTVQSSVAVLVQSKAHFQAGGHVQPGTALPYEVSLCCCL